MKITGHDYPAAAPSLGTLRHSRITTDIRIHLNPATPALAGEANARSGPRCHAEARLPQPPCARWELHGGGGHILAVENELTAKTSSRTRAIMLSLLAATTTTTDDEPPQPNTTPPTAPSGTTPRPRLRAHRPRGWDTLPGDLQQRLGVYDWPKTRPAQSAGRVRPGGGAGPCAATRPTRNARVAALAISGAGALALRRLVLHDNSRDRGGDQTQTARTLVQRSRRDRGPAQRWPRQARARRGTANWRVLNHSLPAQA